MTIKLVGFAGILKLKIPNCIFYFISSVSESSQTMTKRTVIMTLIRFTTY